MASTIQLQRTINLSQQMIRLSPLIFASNTANDPAFSNADWVKQFMLAPPFAWRWNRASGDSPANPTFTTEIGTSDYKVSIPDFGWLEKGTGYDPEGYRSFELKVELIKAEDTNPNEPTTIAAQYDDGAGNITFRLFPAPDKVYNIVIEYQKSASLFTAPTQTWAPVPDYLSFIYNEGFDAKSYEYANDPRFSAAMQLFMQDLSANAEGLSESQKNIWLEAKLNTIRQTQAVQAGRA
jgi:hypothetical protein